MWHGLGCTAGTGGTGTPREFRSPRLSRHHPLPHFFPSSAPCHLGQLVWVAVCTAPRFARVAGGTQCTRMRSGEMFGDPNPRSGERDKQRNTRVRFIQSWQGKAAKPRSRSQTSSGASLLSSQQLSQPLCGFSAAGETTKKEGKKWGKKGKRKDMKRPESSAQFICISSPEGRGNPGKSFLVSADVQGFGGDVSWWPSAPWGCCGLGTGSWELGTGSQESGIRSTAKGLQQENPFCFLRSPA